MYIKKNAKVYDQHDEIGIVLSNQEAELTYVENNDMWTLTQPFFVRSDRVRSGVVLPQTNIRTSPSDVDDKNIFFETVRKYIKLPLTQISDRWYQYEAVLYFRTHEVFHSTAELMNDFPYYSQLGAGVRNACGPTSVAMLAEFYTGNKQNVTKLSRTFDPDQNGTSTTDLFRCGRSVGINLDVEKLPSLVIPQAPAICLVKYVYDRQVTYWDSFWGLHWLVFLAYDNDEVIVHDPLYPGRSGAYIRYKLSEWQESFAAPGRWILKPSKNHLSFSTLFKKVAASPQNDSPL